MQRRIWMRFAAVAAPVALVLGGCAPVDPDPASMGTRREHGLYSGPLLGRHELIASVPIDNPTEHPLRLVSVTPANGYNVTVKDAWAVPLHTPDSSSESSILGVLRWPRDTDEHDLSFNVLKHVQAAAGFSIPAHSNAEWMVTLHLRQNDTRRPMRTAGTRITYNFNRHDHTVTVPIALCFTTPTDTQACPADAIF